MISIILSPFPLPSAPDRRPGPNDLAMSYIYGYPSAFVPAMLRYPGMVGIAHSNVIFAVDRSIGNPTTHELTTD